jgi:hypothetical protein
LSGLASARGGSPAAESHNKKSKKEIWKEKCQQADPTKPMISKHKNKLEKGLQRISREKASLIACTDSLSFMERMQRDSSRRHESIKKYNKISLNSVRTSLDSNLRRNTYSPPNKSPKSPSPTSDPRSKVFERLVQDSEERKKHKAVKNRLLERSGVVSEKSLSRTEQQDQPKMKKKKFNQLYTRLITLEKRKKRLLEEKRTAQIMEQISPSVSVLSSPSSTKSRSQLLSAREEI